MKRSPMPGRRAALRSTTRLKQTPMPPRKKGLKRRAIKASRPKVSPEEREGKKIVRARSGGLCEACGERRAAHWHHRVNRSQMGKWDPWNGMDVCVECHAWIGDFPKSAGVLGWHLESHQDPAAEELRYRGQWVVLHSDSRPPTPTPIPDARRHLAAMADITRRVA